CPARPSAAVPPVTSCPWTGSPRPSWLGARLRVIKVGARSDLRSMRPQETEYIRRNRPARSLSPAALDLCSSCDGLVRARSPTLRISGKSEPSSLALTLLRAAETGQVGEGRTQCRSDRAARFRHTCARPSGAPSG